MKYLRGWRPMLRLAWRETIKARGRSILVLVMIALPVLAVTAADVVMQTANVSDVESLDRRLGSADALVLIRPGVYQVVQGVDPRVNSRFRRDNSGSPDVRDFAIVAKTLGRDVRGLELRRGATRVATDKGVARARASEVDLSDPLAEGLYEVTSGRLPQSSSEVAINAKLASRGLAVGGNLELVDVTDNSRRTIVGIVESTTIRDEPIVFGTIGTLGITEESGGYWLIDSGPVSWSEVRQLNAVGVGVLSRAVVRDPPPRSEIPPEAQRGNDSGERLAAVIALIVAMALMEVVLLAGPAFAVSARRQSRTLALLAATGGTPKQARRVVLAGGLVLGAVAAALGVLLGIAVGWALLPFVQGFSGTYFGPFDVPWLHLVGIAAFGMAAAFLAAVIPAWVASRQDVVAVLAGRRGDRKPSYRSPLIGVTLLCAGTAGAWFAAPGRGSEFLIAVSSVASVVGMIFLVPLVVAAAARLAARLPLPLRYATRDAARHRTRTVPAIAAVAGTVAGVVAFGIANASDGAEREATYEPILAKGQAMVLVEGPTSDVDWSGLKSIVQREIPKAEVTSIRGVSSRPDNGRMLQLTFTVDRTDDGLLTAHGSPFGSVLVSDEQLVMAPRTVDEDERARAEVMLARDGIVVYTSEQVDADQALIGGAVVDWDTGELISKLDATKIPAVFIQVPPWVTAPLAVASPETLATLGIEGSITGLLVEADDITEDQERDVRESIASQYEFGRFYVERGSTAGDQTVIILLIIGSLGGVLMLGGTLTATFLALSDARPDLATLAAVGASPAKRRTVGAAYALVVGLIGAVLGAAAGFIPGIAITYPLTGQSYQTVITETSAMPAPDHFLAIPWILIGLIVVALPVCTAVIVGLTTRPRLPMVARVE